jgi:Bax protein
MKYFSTILTILGIYFFVYACQPAPCTDDGCPEWNELTNPPENPDVGMIVNDYSVVPVVATDNKDDFVYSLNKCITHLYKDVPIGKQIPRELIIAQAALETGWGESRFANEANNLFGIRTWNKDEPYLLPIPWTEWPGWGVKVFETKCDSVAHYIRMINEVFAYEEFREVRAKILEHGEIPNGLDLAPTLTKYASRANYTELVATLIKYNIRGVYEL